MTWILTPTLPGQIPYLSKTAVVLRQVSLYRLSCHEPRWVAQGSFELVVLCLPPKLG